MTTSIFIITIKIIFVTFNWFDIINLNSSEVSLFISNTSSISSNFTYTSFCCDENTLDPQEKEDISLNPKSSPEAISASSPVSGKVASLDPLIISMTDPSA